MKKKKGLFVLTLFGQIRYGFTIVFTKTDTFEIDLNVLEKTFVDKESFINHSTNTLNSYLELLIEQKFKDKVLMLPARVKGRPPKGLR